MTRYNYINGEKIAFTAKEEAQADADLKAWNDEKANRELAELRRERTLLLAETDWMANSDVTMSTAWKNYRQALRDITKTYKNMNDEGFTFPTKPTE